MNNNRNERPFISPIMPPNGICPPLPEPIPSPEPVIERLKEIPFRELEKIKELQLWPPFRIRCLREGCYLIRYTPKKLPFPLLIHYDGTLRVQRQGFNTIASGDLYLHHPIWFFPLTRLEPNPSEGIPIFPIRQYRYYLRVTQILEFCTFGNSFTLGFEMHRFNHSTPPRTSSWTNKGTFTALMKWSVPPSGYPSSSDYLIGDVKDSNGIIIGTLSMGWVSPYLRRAVVEIDRVAVSEAPLNNGGGVDWQDIYEQVGWQVNIIESNTNLTEPSGESWSNAELHAEMLARRDASNHDIEWRYHLLCIRQLDSTSRGIMYDAYGGDTNNIPREGAGISSHWVIPNQVQWGTVQGQRFGATSGPYFRTAIHEIGHAQGLYHNTSNNGIMNTTPTIANNAVAPVQFPDNILYTHHSDDQKKLRHMPDIWIRPGGIRFGESYNITPISPDDMIADAEGIELSVIPLMNVIPYGAPVRVNFTLANKSKNPMEVPARLSMKYGFVKGKVIDPSGFERAFSPIIRCIDEETLTFIEPNGKISHSITLLRGPQGALFQVPGFHTIIINITWNLKGTPIRATGESNVMIMPPVDTAHAETAYHILNTPDALLTLVIGGDHLKEGIEAIQKGVENSVLRPHFALIEAKRLGRRFSDRKPDLDKMAALLDGETVMSPAEIKSVNEIFQKNKKFASSENIKRISQLLQDKQST